MTTHPKVLTVNRHEVWLLTFARAGAQLEILEDFMGDPTPWRFPKSELPSNIKLVKWDQATMSKLDEGYYDFVLTHTIKDLARTLLRTSTPTCHMINLALYKHTPMFALRAVLKWLILLLARTLRGTTVVANSPWKAKTWGLPEQCAIRTPPLEWYERPCPPNNQVRFVTVGNRIATRTEVNDRIWRHLNQFHQVDLLGHNPEIPASINCPDRTSFLQALAKYDVFIYLLEYPWDDSYNLAVLEAMASGLAIVCMTHPYSIHRQGQTALECQSLDECRSALDKLAADPSLVAQLGGGARALVNELFSMEEFTNKWQQEFQRIHRSSRS